MKRRHSANWIPHKMRLLGALVLCAVAVWSGTAEKGAAQSSRPDDRGRIEQDLANTLGVNGTPGFVIGDNLIPGAVDLAALKQMVATARKPN